MPITRDIERGFSLVELSIVLVILGLLTGGILSGQSLIRAAEIRNVITDTQRYYAAIHAFKDKYFALPGDMTNATKFWGNIQGSASDNYTASCYNAPSADGKATCNGNGDGWIYTGTPDAEEQTLAWQHLASAGLISGAFGGGANPASIIIPSGTLPLVPPSKANTNSVWRILQANNAASTTSFALPRANYLIIYKYPAPIFSLRPEEAWNIDTKVDDGKPATGALLNYKGSTSAVPPWPCTDRAEQAVNAALDAAANYNLSYNDFACVLFFKI